MFIDVNCIVSISEKKLSSFSCSVLCYVVFENLRTCYTILSGLCFLYPTYSHGFSPLLLPTSILTGIAKCGWEAFGWNITKTHGRSKEKSEKNDSYDGVFALFWSLGSIAFDDYSYSSFRVSALFWSLGALGAHCLWWCCYYLGIFVMVKPWLKLWLKIAYMKSDSFTKHFFL